MGPGLGWTLPLIRSNARIRRRQKGVPVNKKKRSHPVVTSQRAAQQKNSLRTMGATFRSSPSGDLSCHFEPIPIGEGTAPPR